MTDEELRQAALDAGFDAAGPLDAGTLHPMAQVREMCAADKCRVYGRNWTCPPHCDTLEACAERLARYRRGLLLQTTGRLTKTIDTKVIAETGRRHMEQFHRFCREVRKRYPDALCLGAGGCQLCKTCAYPEPCRFPDEACASMEGYGLFVTQVCRDNHLPYYYGPKTITYTACVLLE